MPVTQAKSAVKIVALLLVCVLSSSAFAAAPTLSAISPSTGTIAGGQTVTIIGTNFQTGNVTSITFGGTAATGIVLISDTKLTCTVPAHAVGAVSVILTNTLSNGANTAYTYTSSNTTLQVNVRVTIPKRAEIQWGAGTTNDDGTPVVNHTISPDQITPYTWIVKDPAIGGNNVDVGTSYLSNDSTNAKTINVSNVSKTNATLTIAAVATNTAGWTIGTPGAVNIFAIAASMNTPTLTPLTAAPANLTVALLPGVDQPLIIQFTTPSSISAATATVTQVSTITLTATAN